MLFWTTTHVNKFRVFSASRKIFQVVNVLPYPIICCKEDLQIQTHFHKIIYACLMELSLNIKNPQNPDLVVYRAIIASCVQFCIILGKYFRLQRSPQMNPHLRRVRNTLWLTEKFDCLKLVLTFRNHNSNWVPSLPL